MELNLSNAWYIINPREVRSIKYYQKYYDKHYSPDEKFENVSEEEKKSIEKIIEIEFNDRIDENGRKQSNIMRISVPDDNLYKYIHNSFARKFKLKNVSYKIDEKIIKKLLDKEFTSDEIAEILKINSVTINKIIEKIKSKNNGT